MVKTLVMCESNCEPPELVGAWVGVWEEVHDSNGGLVMYSLDVSFPVPFHSHPQHIRTFQRPTRDECIEAFGEWLDSMMETDSIYP